MSDQGRGPGWYPDPKDPARSRWWTGRDWSTRTQPNSAARPETARESGSLAPPVPPPAYSSGSSGSSAWNQPIPLDLSSGGTPSSTGPSKTARSNGPYGESVTLTAAIDHAFRNMFAWGGRTSRSGFWWMWATTFVMNVVSLVWDDYVYATYPNYGNIPYFDPSVPAIVDIISLLFVPLALMLSLMTIGAGVRRMHDVGRSGWFILAPFYNVYLCFKASEPSPNRWG
jgi:uncharacterized membrane protein YhaH (DUF805 family)